MAIIAESREPNPFERCLAERESLHRYVTSLLGQDSQSVDDIVQETFLRAWIHRSRLAADDRPVRMWLFRVARNLVVDQYRRDLRSIPVGVGADDFGDPTLDADPAERIVERFVMFQALDRLTREHREAVVRVHLFGDPGSDIADSLSVPLGTVKSRCHNGLRAIRRQLSDCDHDGCDHDPVAISAGWCRRARRRVSAA
ncbi:sigma-70 family RNA polymerase sigma factor [Kribbella sp. NPDC056861]|uniref:sigma-70 family RNA polymerase sigma factor n=1 Tax=Kribbella sp. NPDC056861 TaxID=3154857 RepID=UPI0034160D57